MPLEWPYISIALINKLEEVCPEKCADPEDSLSQIHHYAGKRALVRLLNSIHDDQNSKEH